MKTIIALLALILSAVAVHAEPKKFMETPEYDSYIDFDSKDVKKDHIRVWFSTKNVLKPAGIKKYYAGSSKAMTPAVIKYFYQIDCEYGYMFLLSSAKYNRDGELLGTTTYNKELTYQKDSMNGDMFVGVCEYNGLEAKPKYFSGNVLDIGDN